VFASALAFWMHSAVAAEPDIPTLSAEMAALYEAGQFADAEVRARALLDAMDGDPATPQTDVAATMSWLAALLEIQGSYDEARLVAEEELSILLKVHGRQHVSVAKSLLTLAQIRQAQGDFPGARLLLVEGLEIRRALQGLRHVDVGTALNQLAVLAQAEGDYESAKAYFEEALDIYREEFGPRHQFVALALGNLAGVLMDLGSISTARAAYEESLAIQREVLGPRHYEVATSLNNLASVLYAQGEREASKQLLVESLEIQKDALGPEHPEVGIGLVSMGTLWMAEGDYARARPLMERGLNIVRTALGRHPSVAHTATVLGELVHKQGDLEVARRLFEESADIRRELLGPDHPHLATSLNHLGWVLGDLNEFDRARTLFDEALRIQTLAFGRHHPEVAKTLNNLAGLHQQKGDFDNARVILEESLAIHRAVFGDGHRTVALGLNNLGRVQHQQGDTAAAVTTFEESLDLYRTVVGSDHPEVANTLTNLALVHRARGDLDAARPLLDEALHIMEGRLSLLDFLSEREALLFISSVKKPLDLWLATDDGANPEAWMHVLRFKGALAARARASRALAAVEPEAAAVADQLDQVRRRLARLAFAEGPPDAQSDELASLGAERERLERSLLALSGEHRRAQARAEATPEALCEALPPGAALVDVLRVAVDDEHRYLAFVQNRHDCIVRRVDLGPADAIEAAALEWQEVLRDPNALPQRTRGRGSALAALLWTPLAEAVGGAEHWLVAPDGPLATVPLGALPLEGGYAIESHLITYLDRANDVLRGSKADGEGALVVGDVRYAPAPSHPEGGSSSGPCDGGDFTALPGTAAEAHGLEKRWRRGRRSPLSSLSGGKATEAAVGVALEGKALAHIATHGFFAKGECRAALERSGRDPMLLSGLVLSDGILTASEVATLDLSATQLVVLSACETGLGEIASGQGVLGLRRAFAIAGTSTLMMSLWSISDAATVPLMDRMYRRALKRRDPMSAAEALRAAQLEIIAEQRKAGVESPFTWAGFIAAGDWH